MSFLEKYPSDPTSEKLLSELRKFLGRPNQSNSSSKPIGVKELTHLGMWLMRQLPVARDSVFEFLSATYEEFVKDYINQAEGSPSTMTDEHEELLQDVHEAFIIYLDSNGEVWAPILSQWTLHLLGQLSKEYSNRMVFAHLQSVNEVIHVWMGSKAIQNLLDLTSRCLTCRDHANADTFISALLDTSAAHSPHFDWVVAHVGNSFPKTVVTQVLNLGLQNFSVNPPMISKLSSVVGILGHLVSAHAKEVEHSFDQFIQSGLSENTNVAESYSIPFLLQMCSNSVPLLDVLMDSMIPRIKEETLQKLRFAIPKWIQVHFGGMPVTMMALVTHLILKSSRGPHALKILMEGCYTWSHPISNNARNLLDHFIAEVSNLVYESDSTSKELSENFPCFPAMKENSEMIIEFLTSSDVQISRVSKQLIKLLALYDGESIGVKAICHYFREAEKDCHLWHLIDVISLLEYKFSNILADSINILAIRIDSCKESSSLNFERKEKQNIRKWRNILKVLKTEGHSEVPLKYKLSTVIQENLSAIIPIFDVRKMEFSIEQARIVIEILARIPNLKTGRRFGQLLNLEKHLVEYLFKTLSVTKLDHTEKVKDVTNISKLLHQLSEDVAIQYETLRSLIQFSLYPEAKRLFLPQVKENPKLSYSAFDFEIDDYQDNEFQPEKFSMYTSLMNENQNRVSLSISGNHSTTFHSGKLLKNGNKNWSALPKVVIKENPDSDVNFQLFLSVLINVCNAKCTIESESRSFDYQSNEIERDAVGREVDAMRKVALLLVEIVSPDVMFNGLPWPDEEFSKVQVERDLLIKRAFEDHPYLWDILELIAHHCPSLCYCSVLLRALAATLIAHWTSCQDSPAQRSPTQLNWTIRLVELMKTGQLLPPPLSYIGKVVHELRANEIVGLLKDIWTYMKLNIPVPTVKPNAQVPVPAMFIRENSSNKFIRNPEFCKVDPIHTERLRLAILSNIETLGYLYPKLFPYKSSKSGK